MAHKTDWADKRHYEMLVEQRKFLWLPDTISKLARWMGMKQGMTVLDMGCGLGYLGFTYWRYFGKGGGNYIGVDMNQKLLDDAEHTSRKWARGGTTAFLCSDACDVPLPEATADIVMCQTLLMHLAEPEKALAEMVRMVRPGGVVVCMEPDNLSAELALNASSLPHPPLDIQLIMTRIILQSYEGRIKLGKGDKAIGGKLAMLFNRLGLTDVAIRLNDIVMHLEPPYPGREQQHVFAMMRRAVERHHDENHRQEVDKEALDELRAGGGDKADFDSQSEYLMSRFPEFEHQAEVGEYWMCGGGNFYIAKGRKPQKKI